MTKVQQNKGGLMFADPHSKRFSAIRADYNVTEVLFLVNAINKRLGVRMDREGMGVVCINWLHRFLLDQWDTFWTIGDTYCAILIVKLQKHVNR